MPINSEGRDTRMTTADKAAGAIREALAALEAAGSPEVSSAILNRMLPSAASPAALVAILDEREDLAARVEVLERALRGLFERCDPSIAGSPDSALEVARAALFPAKKD